MNLKGIVSVSGKPGLYNLVGQNKSGFIIESLDGNKVKTVVNITTTKLATLEDITIYGLDEEIRLIDILEGMKKSESIPNPKGSGKELRDFFNEIAPNHDAERVYTSDIKKIISWFNILKELPLFEESPEGETAEEQEQKETNA